MIGFAVGFLIAIALGGNAVIGVAAGIVGAALSVLAYPFTLCWWCGKRGGPRRRDRSGRNWRNCWVCGGSGKRLRFLAWVLGGGR